MIGECKSHRKGGAICADGFVQKAFCGGRAGCFVCGHVSNDAMPYCMRDELPDHMAKDDGSPMFATPPGGAEGMVQLTKADYDDLLERSRR